MEDRTMPKDAVINLRIDSQLKRKLQEKCHDKRLKMTEAIEQAIEQWLDDDSTQSTQSTQDNRDRADDINQLKEDNANLAQRLAKLENTLQKIDSEGLSALLTAANTIEHGKSLAHQNQSNIASLEHSVDELNNAKLEQRLEKLEKRESENYQAIAKLQDTYTPYVTETKQLKEAVRELKYDTQALKINRASRNDIHNLEVVLDTKIDKYKLDERLAMATMPIWETIDGNQNNTAIGKQNNATPKDSKVGKKITQKAIGEEFGLTGNAIKQWFLDKPPQNEVNFGKYQQIIQKYNHVITVNKNGNKTVEFYQK